MVGPSEKQLRPRMSTDGWVLALPKQQAVRESVDEHAVCRLAVAEAESCFCS